MSVVYEIMDLRKVPVDNPKAWVAQVRDLSTWELLALVKNEEEAWKYTFPADLTSTTVPVPLSAWLKELIDKVTRNGGKA